MNDKAFAASTKIFADSARNMEEVVMRMEELMIQQNEALDRFAEKMDKVMRSSGGGVKDKISKLGADVANKLAGAATSFTDALKNYVKFVPVKAEARFLNFIKAFDASIDKDKADAYQGYAKAMNATGEWIGNLGKDLLWWMLVPKNSGEKVAKVVTSMSEAFKDIDVDKMKTGAESMTEMAKGVFLFGLSLVASTALFAIGAIGTLVIVPVIAGFAYMFAQIGKAPEVEAGAKATGWMGLAILGFSAAIVVAGALAGGFSQYAEGAAMMALSMVVFSGLFYLLGGDDFAPRVEAGAKALAWAGLGMASIALGVASFKVLGVDPVSVLIGGLGVLIVGTALGIVGLFGEKVKLGAESILLSGLAMASVALGVWAFQALKITPVNILIAGMGVAITGLVFGLAGAFASEIALGVLVMAFSGLALWSVAAGVKQFKDVKMSDALTAAGTLTAVAGAFVVAGLGALFILPGVAAIGLAGLALVSIAAGLKAFKSINFDDADAVKIKNVIGSLAVAFSAAGGTDGADKLFGITIGPNNVKRGIASVMDAGEALKSISTGLIEFKKLGLGVASAVWKDVAVVVSGIGETFSKLAPGNHTRKGLLGFIGLETNLVEQGVSSVLKTGKALTSITVGLKAFQKLKLGKDSKKLWEDIAFVITGVGAVFATIGGSSKPLKGFFGWIGIEKTDTEKGINAIRGIGAELTNLAKGVAEFATMNFGGVKITETVKKAAMDNIRSMLLTVSDVFGGIGDKSKDKSGLAAWFTGAKDNPVAMGIAAIQGIGKELTNIGDAVKMFADPKIVQMSSTSKQNMKNVIESLAESMQFIGGTDDRGTITKGTQAIAGLGTTMKSLADAMSIVAGIKDFDRVKFNLKSMAESLPAVLLSLNNIPKGSGIEMIERLANASGPIGELADSFSKLAAGMGKFADSMKKMNVDTAKTTNMLIQSLVVFSKIDPNALSSLSDKGKALLQFMVERNDGKEKIETLKPAPASPQKQDTPKTAEPPYIKPAPQPQQKPDAFALETIQAIESLKSVMVRIEAQLHDRLKVEVVNS